MTNPVLFVYSRPGCHLCEQLIEELLPLIRGRAQLEIRNVDTRENWQTEFGTRIPVLTMGDRVISEYHLDRETLDYVLETRTNGQEPHCS